MKRTLTSLFLAGISFLAAFSQFNLDEPPKKWISSLEIESGLIYPQGTIKESVSIRQNISYYTANQYSSGRVSALTSGFNAGIRYGYYFPAVRSGISAGVRVTGLTAELSGYTSDISEFFYLRYSMQGSETKFARVKSMSESTYFLSIPLEVSVVPVTYKNLSVYVRAGVEFGFLNFRSDADIVLQDESMEVHKEAVLSSITAPAGNNYSTFNSAIGCKFGQEGMPGVMFEVYLPSLFLTKDLFTLIDADYYQGVKLIIQLPLNNK